ncbi:MAG: hypothetical protein KA535_00090 [Azonexus sp.]|nr:hypothetical protein [Azonexus sp.]
MNDTPDDPRDPQLSRLYRKASQGEPPPALDAAIIAAARAATAASDPPRPWWRRLQAPFALAATVVLAVVLTLSMERNPPPAGDIPAAKTDRAPAPAREQAAPARPNAADAQSAGVPAPKAAQRPPAAPDQQKPATSLPEDARPPSTPTAPGQPAANAAKSAPGQAAEAKSADRLGNENRGTVAEPAAAALEAKRETAARQPHLKPAAWIEEIRKLRRQGQTAEAERSLREFRAAYPDYPLPEDLR